MRLPVTVMITVIHHAQMDCQHIATIMETLLTVMVPRHIRTIMGIPHTAMVPRHIRTIMGIPRTAMAPRHIRMIMGILHSQMARHVTLTIMVTLLVTDKDRC